MRTNRGKPSVKLDSYCICTLTTHEFTVDGSVTASVFPVHNHWIAPRDLRNASLSAGTRALLSSLVSIGLDDNAIMRMVQTDVLEWQHRNDFDQSVTRDNLVSKQDIRNAKRVHTHQHHSCDTTSFDMMVRELLMHDDGPVLFYKGPGEPARNGLAIHEWCLVLATQFMLQQLEENVPPSLSPPHTLPIEI
jgi:hypothetical protein